MKRSRTLQFLVIVLLSTSWPALVMGETQSAAGVVTALSGRASLARPALPAPRPLQFKDNLFLRDTINTAENSIVRALLGGKALVTIRELSVFTLTEEVGRSTVNLARGKMALVVARQRMRPDEIIEIRTPNAVTAVRGTVVVVEVKPAPTAQLTPGPALMITIFSVLQGAIEVFSLGAPTTPVTVGALKSVSVTGATIGAVQPISSSGAAQLTQVLKAPLQHVDTPKEGQSQVVLNHVAKATVLANVLTGQPATGPQAAAPDPVLVEASSPVASQATTTGTAAATTTVTTTTMTASQAPVVSTSEPTAEATETIEGSQEVQISDTTRILAAGETLRTFSGVSTRVPTTPAVQITASTVSQASPGTLILVDAGANATLAGPLLDVTNSQLSPGTNLLLVQGSISSSSTSAFINLDPTTIAAPGDFLQIGTGGALSLTGTGPLLADAGGTFNVTGNFLSIAGGGTLESTTSRALLQFNGSTVNVGNDNTHTHLLRVDGAGSQANLAGPLLSATHSALTVNIGTTSPGAFSALVEAFGGGVLTSTSTQPFINLNGGALALEANVRGVNVVGAGSAVTLGGSLFKASNAPVTTNGDAPFVVVGNGASLTLAGQVLDLTNVNLNLGPRPIISITGGSTLASTAGPLFKITGGSLTAAALTTTDGTSNKINRTGTLLDLTGATVTLPTLGASVPPPNFTRTLAAGEPEIRMANSTLNLTSTSSNLLFFGPGATSGVGLIATSGSTINLAGTLLGFVGSGVSLPDPNPVIQLTSSTVKQTGSFTLLNMGPQPVTLAGPLLSATDSSITTGPSTAIVVFGSPGSPGSLTSTTSQPLVSLVRSSFTPGGSFFSLSVNGNSATLAGPLLKATDTTLAAKTTTPFMFLADNASLTLGGPLLDLTNTPLNLGAQPIIRITGGSTLKTTAGPLFKVTGGSLIADALIITDGAGNQFNLTGTLLDLTNTTVTLRVTSEEPVTSTDTGTLTLGVGEPLFRVTNSTLTVTGGPLITLSATNFAGETVEGNSLFLGTERVPRGPGVCPACPVQSNLLEASGATLGSAATPVPGAVALDTVLLEATLPLINLVAGSSMTSNSPVIDLLANAKLVASNPGGALVNLNASTLAVTNGSLFNVAGGSFLDVIGSLVSLNNTSALSLSNGALVFVSEGSVFRLTGGSLAVFGSTGANALNITNAACAGACPTFGGVRVALQNGATAANIVVEAGFTRFSGGAPAYSGLSAADLVINGASSRVRLRP